MDKTYDAIIIGAGPAGIFCAIELLKNHREANILILEKGLIHRKCPKEYTKTCVGCNPCQISSGWGGSGAFSDGKLSLDPQVGGELPDYVGPIENLISYADGIYLEFGGNRQVHFDEEFAREVAYKASKHSLQFVPCRIRHLGTEKSAQIMLSMFDWILSFPHTEVRELCPVKGILTDENGSHIEGVELPNGEKLYAKNVVAGVGRSGSEWLLGVCQEVGIETADKEVDIGVRVEVPRAITDEMTDRLYEVKLVHWNKNKVRTFCMNPGGFVSQENYDDHLAVVNGHCYQDRKSDNTNFALLTSLSLSEPFHNSIEYGKKIASLTNQLTGGAIIVQRLEDLKLGRRTNEGRMKKTCITPTLADAVPGDIGHAYTPRIIDPILSCLKEMEHLCPGIDGADTLLYAPEVKFYSSKVKVDRKLMTEVAGFYCIGDGAGITRGLMQASVSGIVAARAILGIQ